ncbi:MAG TPA: hypothetical protein VFI91_08340 [Longimicrobiaceae bacterium]|nr:hypothetical protein [Longimicrobiaceae bacterium]
MRNLAGGRAIIGQALTAVALVASLAPVQVHGQSTADPIFSISPGWLRAEDTSSLGLRFEAFYEREDISEGDGLPTWLDANVSFRGAVAVDPDANPEALDLSARVGWLKAFYEPGTASGGPDDPPVGGYDYGSIQLSFAGSAAADQRFREANAALGLRVGYVAPNADIFLSAGPRVAVSYSGVLPISSEVREALNASASDSHGRLDLTGEWHPYIPQTPVRLHASLRYWSADGLDAAFSEEFGDSGFYQSYALAYVPMTWRFYKYRVQELFVRWTDGDLPVAPVSTQAWMLGVRVGL